MTHLLSSSTESKALRIGDPEITVWIPVFTGMTHFCHPQPKAPLSSSTESEALRIGDPEITDWIPVFTGMTREGYGNDTFFVILNRKRSASDWGSIPSRHSALDAGSIQTGFPFSRE